MNTKVAEFEFLGNSASYFYADNSCKEWHLAEKYKLEALEIFDTHPELQPLMRENGRHFLWSLERERPSYEKAV